MSIIFFPGTFIHEVAHYSIALLLGVPAGEMKLFPKLEGKHVKLGSVSIAKTDRIRRFFIGIAPFLVGTSLILTTIYYMSQTGFFDNIYLVFLGGYVLFEISNTMFSSKKDMEGALELLAIISCVVVGFYVVGLRIPAVQIGSLQEATIFLFEKGVVFLAVPLVIDIASITFLRIMYALLD